MYLLYVRRIECRHTAYGRCCAAHAIVAMFGTAEVHRIVHERAVRQGLYADNLSK